jgi:phosphomannomutase
MPHWFGSSGIRGSYEKINPFFSMKLGIAVRKVIKTGVPAVIASDVRYTSNLLKSSFMSGYTSESGSIVDIGLAPTPVLSYFSYNRSTLGVMLTASHNPPSNNGFKLFLNGAECEEALERKIEDTLEKELKKAFYKKKIQNAWKIAGEIVHENNHDYFDKYLKYILKSIKIRKVDWKIVLDCANNVPNLISPQALKKIGIKELITINKSLDASFPGRPSEPSAGNLDTLRKTVIKEKADLGIAHDGDGDRFAIIDEKGHFVNSTALISFFADHLDYSDPNRKKVILSSDCTKQAKEIAEKKGGSVVISKIGKNKEFVNDDNVLFLAEPNKLIFPELGKWIDGLYPVLRLIELSQLNPFSEIMKDYDKRKILRKAFKIAEKDRIRINSIINQLPENWSKMIHDISQLDGLKLFFKDDSSLLIRFSGTEPKIKFYIESSSIKKNETILKKVIDEFNLTFPSFDC